MALYPAINPTTAQLLVAGNPNAKQQLWLMKVHWESRGKNPFAALTGGANVKGGPRFPGRPLLEIMETRKVKGDTVNLQTSAALGAEGVQGDSQRTGNEETIRNGGYQFTIGRMWNGVGWTSVTANQTVVGSKLDAESNRLLGEWLGWRKAQDIEVEMLVNMSGYNTLYPNNKSSRENLRTTDYVSGETITRAQMTLGTLQAKPVHTTTGKGGQPIYHFIMVGNQYSLFTWKQTGVYQTILSNAREKGDKNELFAGGLPDWSGVMIHEWTIEDTSANATAGAPCVPRAFLGNAIASTQTTTFQITGGGNPTSAALANILYFKNFSNSGWTGFEGSKRSATTATTRYVLIQNLVDSGLAAGGGANNDVLAFGFYSYATNNGNTLTCNGRLQSTNSGIGNTNIGNVNWNVAPWVTAYLTVNHAAGSVIYETNSYGVPFVRSYVMGNEALISGYGTVDGTVCMGQRTEEVQDHGRVRAIGIDACWGVKAIPRVDGIINGFVVIESAFSPPGLPSIT